MFLPLLFLKLLISMFTGSKETRAFTHQDNATYWREIETEAHDFVPKEFLAHVVPDFHEIRLSKSFIDKTGLIKELLSFHQSFLYLTAPPRVGKTVNINMLKRYLDAQSDVNGTLREINSTSNHELFVDTELLKKDKSFFEKHNQQYKVISLNFQHLVDVKNFGSFKIAFCGVIYNMMKEHWYLKKKGSSFPWFNYTRSEDSCLTYCLDGFVEGFVSISGRSLSEELFKTYSKPVVVLGDEYSAILHAFLENDVEEAQKIWEYLSSFVKNLVKDNPNVHRAFFVGSLTLGGVTSSLADNVFHYNFNDMIRFGKYFGFTQRDVDCLLVRLQKTDSRGAIQQWYSGYSIKDEPATILYNPLPIISFLSIGVCQDYWVHQGDLSYLKSFFGHPEVGRAVQRIQMGDSGRYTFSKRTTFDQILRLRKYISDPNIKNIVPETYVALFIQYLTESGFFTADHGALGDAINLKPTNFETKEFLDRTLYTTDFLINALEVTLDDLVNYAKAINLLSGNETSVQNLAKFISVIFAKKCHMKDERIDLLGALYGVLKSYHVDIAAGSFMEVSINPFKTGSGKPRKVDKWGRVDMLVITSSLVGIIMETSLKNPPDAALKGIVDKCYQEAFQEHFSEYELHHKILMGVSLDDKCNCRISYLCDSTDLNQAKQVSHSGTR